jgi:hypothetical protein
VEGAVAAPVPEQVGRREHRPARTKGPLKMVRSYSVNESVVAARLPLESSVYDVPKGLQSHAVAVRRSNCGCLLGPPTRNDGSPAFRRRCFAPLSMTQEHLKLPCWRWALPRRAWGLIIGRLEYADSRRFQRRRNGRPIDAY